jgi:hypothetical protein
MSRYVTDTHVLAYCLTAYCLMPDAYFVLVLVVSVSEKKRSLTIVTWVSVSVRGKKSPIGD